MRHVGRGDRWSAQIVAEQSMDAIDPRAVAGGKPPEGRDNELAWLHQGVQDCSTPSNGPARHPGVDVPRPPAGEVVDARRLHETAVHRADAALALGAEFVIDPAVAADGITEYLERVFVRADAEGPAGGDRPLGDGQSLHLHATDPGLGEAGEWTILGRPDGIAVDHEHGKSTTALRGPARDLLLAIVRRRAAADLGLEIFGDPRYGTPGWPAHPF